MKSEDEVRKALEQLENDCRIIPRLETSTDVTDAQFEASRRRAHMYALRWVLGDEGDEF